MTEGHRNTSRGAYTPEDAAEHPEAWGRDESTEVTPPADTSPVLPPGADVAPQGENVGGDGIPNELQGGHEGQGGNG